MAIGGRVDCTRREHRQLIRECGREFSGGVKIPGGRGTRVGQVRVKAAVGRRGYGGEMGGEVGIQVTFF